VAVEVVEPLQVGAGVAGVGRGDDDAFLGGLLDVAPPLLVHPLEDVVLGAVGQGDPEDVLRLARREPALDGLRLPAELPQPGDDALPGGSAFQGRDLAETAYVVVGDALLDLAG
jgi:hypothetical protein